MGISIEKEIEELKERLTVLTAELADSSEDISAKLSKKAKKAARKVQDYAEENPWQVAGMAAAAGLVVAIAVSAALRSKREE